MRKNSGRRQPISLRVEDGERIVSFSAEQLHDASLAAQFVREMAELMDSDESDWRLRAAWNLDFGPIEWLGSEALNQLIAVRRHARRRGIRLVLINVQPRVRDIFELTRLERTFELWPAATLAG